MDISDLIGKGKIFEPPFHIENRNGVFYVVDNHFDSMLIINCPEDLYYMFSFEETNDIQSLLVENVCDLLNKEYNEKKMECNN